MKTTAPIAAVVGLLCTNMVAAQTVQWEVVERFRLLKQPEQATWLYDQIRVAPAKAAAGRSYEYPSPLKSLATSYATPALPATYWDASRQRYEEHYAHPQGWSLRVSLPSAKPAQQCEWKLRSSVTPSRGPCSGFVLAGAQQEDELTVMPVDGPVRLPLSAAIHIAHRRVVVLGDSYAAGEGVPDVNQEVTYEQPYMPTFGNFAYWWDQRCHRSLLAAGVQSTLKWAMADAHRSVTTLSYACSGAAIGLPGGSNWKDGGILEGFNGKETTENLHERKKERAEINRYNVSLQTSEEEPLQPQINQAVQDLCAGELDKSGAVWACKSNLAQPDLVIFSIGGNDAGFGRIIAEGLKGNCGAGCVNAIAGSALKNLGSRYDELAALLNSRLAPRHVLMLDYGDPTRDERKNFCAHDGSPLNVKSVGTLWLRLSASEFRNAYNLVVHPLNEEGARLVERNRAKGWYHLGIMEKATNSKGLCSRKSWFNSTWAAYIKQYLAPPPHLLRAPSGVVHPNVIYHAYQADGVVDWMTRTGF